jgi:type IV pilus assembly protein PilA
MLARTRKAFTLLELIVVIVILGILALIAIPTYNAVMERSRQSSAKRTAEAVGRSAVALAKFDQAAINGDVDGAGAGTATFLDNAVTEANRDGALTGVDRNVAVSGTPTATGASLIVKADGKSYTVAVSVNGSVVSTPTGSLVETAMPAA